MTEKMSEIKQLDINNIAIINSISPTNIENLCRRHSKSPQRNVTVAGFDNIIRGRKDYSPSTGASSSSLTRVSISPDFSPVFVLTKKFFMKTFGATALGAPSRPLFV